MPCSFHLHFTCAGIRVVVVGKREGFAVHVEIGHLDPMCWRTGEKHGWISITAFSLVEVNFVEDLLHNLLVYQNVPSLSPPYCDAHSCTIVINLLLS